jgi:hypothetical protein
MGLCLIEAIIFPGRLTGFGSEIYRAQQVVFLNGTHILFTYIFIGFTSAGRSWVRDHLIAFGSIRFVSRFLLVLGGAFIISFAGKTYLAGYPVMKYVFIFLQILVIHHGFTQSKGIWMLMNPDQQKIDFIRSVSHFAFGSFSALWIGLRLELISQRSFLYIFLIISMILLYRFIKGPLNGRDNNLFSVRFFIPFLFPFSDLSNYGQASVHGTEYAAVVARQSRNAGVGFLRIILVFIILSFVFVAMSFPAQASQLLGVQLVYPYRQFIEAMLYSLLLGHYFLDHFLYSRRYDASLKNIFPTLR